MHCLFSSIFEYSSKLEKIEVQLTMYNLHDFLLHFFRDLSQIRTNCQKKIESRLKVDQIFSKYKLLSVSTLQLLQNSRKYHNNLELAVGASTRHLNLYFKYLSSYLNSQTCKLNREQSIKRAFYWLIYSIHSVRCKAIRRILMNSVNSANSTIFSKYSKLISSV